MTRPREDRYDEIFHGSHFNDEERDFIRAIDQYQSATGRKFLSWHEVLRVVRAMGYRRVRPDGSAAEGAD